MKWAALILFATTLHAQETCRSCSPKDMQLQFGDEVHVPAHFFTKPYVAAESVHVLAGITDILITLKRENKSVCLEGNNGFPEFVHAPELVGEFSVELGFGLFVRWAMTREKPPRWANFISYMTPAYGTTLHVIGATRWYRNCQH